MLSNFVLMAMFKKNWTFAITFIIFDNTKLAVTGSVTFRDEFRVHHKLSFVSSPRDVFILLRFPQACVVSSGTIFWRFAIFKKGTFLDIVRSSSHHQ